MIDPTYCETMASYNQWMNRNLYQICAEIPDATRREDRGAFFKSIHGTLNHLLVADRIWMGRFTQQPFVVKLDQELYIDFAELWQARQQTDQAIFDWAKDLSSEWLSQDFTYTSVSGNRTATRPAWLLVSHLFNHQTHHRGQLTTLLSQLGYDPGVTDLPWMPDFSAAV